MTQYIILINLVFLCCIISLIFGSWSFWLGLFCDKDYSWSPVTTTVRLTSDTHLLEKTLQHVCWDSFDRFAVTLSLKILKSHSQSQTSSTTHNKLKASTRVLCLRWTSRSQLHDFAFNQTTRIPSESERKTLIVYDVNYQHSLCQ